MEPLENYTVKLRVSGRQGFGTGFSVAPGLLLTCAHVVEYANNQPVPILWKGKNDTGKATIIVERFLEQYDLALLKCLTVTDLPWVVLDEDIKPDDSIYIYGYSDKFPDGCPVTGLCEGFTGGIPQLIKFKAGHIRPGLSGSPLVNQRTGKVCGIVKRTLERSFPLGGLAVPVSFIWSQWHDLKELNYKQPTKPIPAEIQHYLQEMHNIILDAKSSPNFSEVRERFRKCRTEISNFLSASFGTQSALTLVMISPQGATDKARLLNEATQVLNYLTALSQRSK